MNRILHYCFPDREDKIHTPFGEKTPFPEQYAAPEGSFHESFHKAALPSGDEGPTILSFLREQGYSHRLIAALKRDPEGILLNGERVRVSRPVSAGDILRISIRAESEGPGFLPRHLPVRILYEDADLLVIDKPPGISVHPSAGHYETTVANALAWHYCNDPPRSYIPVTAVPAGDGDGRIHFSFHCINRLDRDTSGLLIVAKHALSGAILSEEMNRRRIHRVYLAIVKGLLPLQGTIDLPIARQEGSVMLRCIDPVNGQPCVTHFNRIYYEPLYDLSLAEIRLETGRTHQIRVHMKAIGHPLPGDFLYYPDFQLIGRQSLHSSSLSWFHPITGLPMECHSPLPEDMRRLLPGMRWER